MRVRVMVAVRVGGRGWGSPDTLGLRVTFSRGTFIDKKSLAALVLAFRV